MNQERQIAHPGCGGGVNVVLLSDRRLFGVVKQPDRLRRPIDGCDVYTFVVSSGAVDMLVQAIMKKIDPIAALGIGRANPD